MTSNKPCHILISFQMDGPVGVMGQSRQNIGMQQPGMQQPSQSMYQQPQQGQGQRGPGAGGRAGGPAGREKGTKLTGGVLIIAVR